MTFEPKKTQVEEGLSAAMVIRPDNFLEGSPFNMIDVYLINDSDMSFKSAKVLTGAYCSIDDDLMKTGEAVSNHSSLKPKSILKIGVSDIGELDYVVWFNIDLVDEKGEMLKYACSLPKYNRETQKVPLLDVPAVKLDFVKRTGESIDEYVATHDLQPQYIKAK